MLTGIERDRCAIARSPGRCVDGLIHAVDGDDTGSTFGASLTNTDDTQVKHRINHQRHNSAQQRLRIATTGNVTFESPPFKHHRITGINRWHHQRLDQRRGEQFGKSRIDRPGLNRIDRHRHRIRLRREIERLESAICISIEQRRDRPST